MIKEALFEDPVAIQRLLGKHVRVETVDNNVHSGYVYIIDPQSKCTILADSEETSPDVRMPIIPFHAIKSFDVSSPGTARDIKVFKSPVYKSDFDLNKRKNQLKEWLKQNLIDVVDDGSVLKYQDYLVIEPPFNVDSCYCSNTIVLERIQNIIKNM